MVIDGLGRNGKPLRDLRVAQPLPQQSQDIHFTGGQSFRVGLRRRPGASRHPFYTLSGHLLAQLARCRTRPKLIKNRKRCALRFRVTLCQGKGAFEGTAYPSPFVGRCAPISGDHCRVSRWNYRFPVYFTPCPPGPISYGAQRVGAFG